MDNKKPTLKVIGEDSRINYVYTNAYNALLRADKGEEAEEMAQRLFAEKLEYAKLPTDSTKWAETIPWHRAMWIIGQYVEFE